MYTICYIAFFVLSTAAAFKNDKGNQMHFTNNKTRYTLPLFITACSHNENAKTGYSFCYALFFMAESKGFGSLRSPSSLLRKLSYYRLLLTRLRLAKDYKGSNSLLSYQKNIGYSKRYTLYFWRRARDSNPRTVLGGYTISNRAPSTSSDNSP